jgi:hypothetical protein
MKILFKIVLVLLILYVCGVAGAFFGGVLGAIGAVYFHADPQATALIVRLLTIFFFCGFVLLAWVIYSRRRERRLRQKK